MGKPPLIIIGMHRSGTTMITKLLENLGMFFGHKKEINSESIFFHQLNRWIMVQSNSAWDNPLPAHFKNDFHNQNINRVLEAHLSGLGRHKYLGKKKLLKYRSLKNIDFDWGWKDPANTLNIDHWKAVFPDAKILNIYRNPVDIAESLRVREHKVQGRFKLTLAKQIHEKVLTPRRLYNRSVRLFDIMEGIKLWENYIEAAEVAREKYRDLWLDIKYEEFLDEPLLHLKTITDFVGLNASDQSLNELTKVINNDRKFAFSQDERLMEVYQAVKNRPLISKLGYDDIY